VSIPYATASRQGVSVSWFPNQWVKSWSRISISTSWCHHNQVLTDLPVMFHLRFKLWIILIPLLLLKLVCHFKLMLFSRLKNMKFSSSYPNTRCRFEDHISRSQRLPVISLFHQPQIWKLT
jgi:hypothetical protein